jgi:hypothetical protein
MQKNEVTERLSQRCTDLDKTVPALLGISAVVDSSRLPHPHNHDYYVCFALVLIIRGSGDSG